MGVSGLGARTLARQAGEEENAEGGRVLTTGFRETAEGENRECGDVREGMSVLGLDLLIIHPVLIKSALLNVPDLTKLDLEHSPSFGAKVGERP